VTAPELSEDERRIVERFEAAEYPPEVAAALAAEDREQAEDASSW
jgi:hypothetical protein